MKRTLDFRRIEALPRRAPPTKREAIRLAKKWTRELAKVRGVTLLPWQGAALEEAHLAKGGVFSLPVGSGKFYIAEALPIVLRVSRSVLIIPGSLKDKTFSTRRKWAHKWRLASPPPRIITREELALESNAGLLEYLKPELIIEDESHKGGNFDRGVPARVHRYVKQSQ